MYIQFIKREDINLDTWHLLSNPKDTAMIYNQWWYIDSMSDSQWGALVVDNYRLALPLPFRKKMGLQYIYQPFITQRFDLIGESLPAHNTVGTLISAIPSRFVVVNLSIGSQLESFGQFKVIERTNHILDLNCEYEKIAAAYNRNTRRNIQAAEKSSLVIDFGLNFRDFLMCQISWEPQSLTAPHKLRLLNLWHNMNRYAEPFIATAYVGKNPVAVGLFCVYAERLYFLLCASNLEGKEQKAMFWLLDNVIRRYARQRLVLDFTGSSIPDIARRNLGFGAQTETFFAVEKVGLVSKLRKWFG